MSWDINRVVIVGRLTRDPELNYSANNEPVCRFGIANGRGTQEGDVNFFDCVAFKKNAEFVGQRLHKGSQVVIEGKLRFDRFTTKEGQTRNKVEIVADSVQAVGPRPEGSGEGRAPSAYGGGEARPSGGYGEGRPSGYGQGGATRPPEARPTGDRPAAAPGGRGNFIPIDDMDGDVPF